MDNLILFLKQNQIPYNENVSLSAYSTFRIGGQARLLAQPENLSSFCSLITFAQTQNIKTEVIGRGSNILFSDNGFDGLIIYTSHLSDIYSDKQEIVAECGVSLTELARIAEKASLSGLEFAYGIPGSVGGAVVMNAGAFGGEMSQVVSFVDAYDILTGETIRLYNTDLNFSYRNSIFLCQSQWLVLRVGFHLKYGNSSEIKTTMENNMKKRKDSQPLNYPSAGSVFKRPEHNYAGKLIEECGLKGFRIGGAEVSEKHAGFIINRDNATAADVRALIKTIQDKVQERFGIMLEVEIRL